MIRSSSILVAGSLVIVKGNDESHLTKFKDKEDEELFDVHFTSSMVGMCILIGRDVDPHWEQSRSRIVSSHRLFIFHAKQTQEQKGKEK